ncbi:adenylate/guanylate cyclase domain-containing protein [Pseudonocardia sp. GCM10023141]|uniref:adenylate/guanylate cyclase domain-containing protein n=1 Tax=Pseudonocardia sp. GCM10023141 TaxID=3252653 RepID=UPI003612D74C
MLGGPRRYTRLQLNEAAGLEPAASQGLWRALGFADVPDDAVLFTDGDLAALRLMTKLTDAGVLDPSVREAVTRAVAQSMSRLTEWQVGMLRSVIETESDTKGGPAVTPQQSLQIAAALVPTLEELQTYVWRRHLAATINRMLVTSGDISTGDDGTTPLAVGFADMVGFTRTTRRRSTDELADLIEGFGSSTSQVIAGGGGRIVKTVGDEVLFVADGIVAAADIALDLQERVRSESSLPDLRIGLAAGPVLVRYGDVYGEVVNIAARLTSHARPDTVLVDRTVADALDGNRRFALRAVRTLSVRGYRHLHPWLLERP